MSTTIVTCYYKVNSKHSFDKYDKWLTLFLNNVNNNIIIFTSNDLVHYLKDKIKNDINFKIIVKELDELYISKKYDNKFWNNQYQLDKQKTICNRTIECYKIWNSKLDFLHTAINFNPFNSTKFIWNDIGNIRNNKDIILLKDYPKYNNISEGKIDIIMINNININDNNKIIFFNDDIVFSGSIFGGDYESILKFHKLFYLYFDIYIANNKFIGCDQQIIASIYLKNKELFNTITPNNIIIDKWFWLYYYYSQ